MDSSIQTIANDVIRAAKLLYERGLVNAYEGNVSARIPGDRLLITPSQVCKAELTGSDLVEVDILTGETVSAANNRVASSEVKMHICCYLTRADIMGVAHAHPVHATAFALCGMPIETRAYPEMMVLYGKIPICAYGRPSTQSLCAGIPEALSSYDAFLLANHGLTTTGASAMEAAYKLEGIESIASTLIKARSMGGEKALPVDEVEALEQWRLKIRSNLHE